MYYLDFGDEQVIGASPRMLVTGGETPSDDRTYCRHPTPGPRQQRRQTTCPRNSCSTRKSGPNTRCLSILHEMIWAGSASSVRLMLPIHGCRKVLSCPAPGLDSPRYTHGSSRLLRCAQIAVSRSGTVSGAPKIRAMQIISETEPDARGIYAGAVGYIGFDRNLEFAIAIRTVSVKNGLAYIQTGAGIVADSYRKEWIETEVTSSCDVAGNRTGRCCAMSSPIVLIVDCYDSFTFNLYQQVGKLGARPVVSTCDTPLSHIKKICCDRIILSPGPGTPEDSGLCLDARYPEAKRSRHSVSVLAIRLFVLRLAAG